jgi:hypothetical protein
MKSALVKVLASIGVLAIGGLAVVLIGPHAFFAGMAVGAWLALAVAFIWDLV